VTVYREGRVATLAFGGGDVSEHLAVRTQAPGGRTQGTTVQIWIDPKYFETVDLPLHDLRHLLRSKVALMPGVSVTLTIEKTGEVTTWLYQGGLRDYLMQTLNADPLIPLFEGDQYASASETENYAEGEGAAWCVAFTEDGSPVRESYVNLIPTVAGGTHEAGLKDGLFGAIKSFIDMHGLLPKGVKLMLFFRHLSKLVERGVVHVAKPPLFRVDAPTRGKKPAAKFHALDDGELNAILDKLRKEGCREGAWTITRFKGLGEMSAEQLWETTLSPDTRCLLPVTYGSIDRIATTDALTKLMGKGEAAARRELMELHGDAIEVDV